MKCYEITKCSEQERAACFVWNSFRANPQEMENVKCWVLKGAYQSENRDLLTKCRQCTYYLTLNKDMGIVSDYDADVAVVKCEGTINNDRARALEQVWAGLRQNKKSSVVLDLSTVNNIYSCGLGIVVKIHKEAAAAGGQLIIIGARGYVQQIFIGTKLNKILTLVADRQQAAELFEAARKKHEDALRAAQEAARPKVAPAPRKRVPCWEYWKNHNPRNATKCDECFKKISPTSEPCWIVEGMIESVSFQYVNEDCEGCSYFKEFGSQTAPAAKPEELNRT